MSWNNNDFDFEKDLKIDFEVYADFDVDVEVKVDKDIDIDIKVDSDIDLDGNSAELTLLVEALGSDTDAEAIASVLTIENEMSSIDVWAFAASD